MCRAKVGPQAQHALTIVDIHKPTIEAKAAFFHVKYAAEKNTPRGTDREKMTRLSDALTYVTVGGLALFDTPVRAEPALPPVTVLSVREKPADLPGLPGASPAVYELDLEHSEQPVTGMDQLLVEQGWVSSDANNSLGLSNGLNVRGFSVDLQGSSQLMGTRNFLNGHADIAWRFARDPATVARVQVLSGHDATLLGAGSPGGSLHYTTKSPTGTPFLRARTQLADHGARRLSLDGEWHAGPVQTRVVLTTLRGDRTAEGVSDSRDVLLLSNRLRAGPGVLRLDLENHISRLPFPFGTSYVNGRFWWDTPYVDTTRAKAHRHYMRQALYWEQPLNEDMTLKAHWQGVRSGRNETLLGAFDIRNTTQMRGYYRLIDEHNRQGDLGLSVNGDHTWGTTRHQWTLAWQQLDMRRDFSGPQNIGGYTLDLAQPVFPQDLDALTLSPRYAFERYHERGLSMGHVLSTGPWELRAGLRRAQMRFEGSSQPNQGLRTTTDAGKTSASISLRRHISATQQVWLSRTESFLPNRGRSSDGAFLPPSEGRQWESGWRWQTGRHHLAVSAYDLRQSKLPGRDPDDPDALRLIGSLRSQGVSVLAGLRAGHTDWQMALTHQRARVEDKVRATQGVWLVGVPDTYGALSARHALNPTTDISARLHWSASRPGNDRASFRTPGYGVLGVGVSHQLSRGTRLGLDIGNLFDRRYARGVNGADAVWQGPRRRLWLWIEVRP